MKITYLVLVWLLTACNFPAPNNSLPSTSPTARIEFNTQISPTQTQSVIDTDNPIPGKIVYTCQVTRESYTNQICVINPDGTGWRQLTDDLDANNFFPSFSPNGQAIVFSSNRTGAYEIWEVNLEGNLTQLTDSGAAVAPAISPDNTKIIYSYNQGTLLSDSQIWVMTRTGENRYPLTNLDGGAWDPVWSPDGSRMLFASQLGVNVQLFTMAADGSDLRQITSLEGLRGRNDWSLHGVLATYIGTTWNREIITFDVDGTNVTYLTDGGNNLAPSFSPDGKWITFTSYKDNYEDDHGCEIYIMRIDGTDVQRLTDNDYCDWQPRWGN